MRVSVKRMLSPVCIICATATVQLLVLVAYVARWWESWRIEFNDVSLGDFVWYGVIWVVLLMSVCLGESLFRKTEKQVFKTCAVERNIVIDVIVWGCTVISVIGTLFMLKGALGIGGANAFRMGVQGSLRAEMAGSGFLALAVFSYLGVVICSACGKRKALLAVNIACLLVTGTMYAARMYFFAAVVMVVVVRLRRNCWENRIRFSFVGIVVAVVAALTIAVASLREFENSDDFRSTEQPVEWGVRTMVDYPLSTAIYSMHVDDMPPSAGIISAIPVLKRLVGEARPETDDDMIKFRDCYGHAGYSNLGGWSQVQRVFGTAGGLFVLALFGLCAGFLWMKFSVGDAVGLLLYPVFAYALLEFWRIAYLLEEIPQLVLFCLICILPFARKVEDCSACAS